MPNRGCRIKKNGFLSIISLVIVLAVMAILSCFLLKSYTGNKTNKTTQTVLKNNDIDSSSHKAILKSTKNKLDKINKDIDSRQKELLTSQ